MSHPPGTIGPDGNAHPLRVVVCRVGAPPAIEMIPSGLKSMQAIVGGMIELIRLTRTVDMWCNDNALAEGLLPNRQVGDHYILGDFFIASHNAEGDTVGLTEEDAAAWVGNMSLCPMLGPVLS